MAICDATIHIDNDKIRITKFRFSPGDETGYHRHEMDYTIIPITDGTLRIIGPDGEETQAELKKGDPYYREKGVEHNVINSSSGECIFLEVGLKK